MTKPTASGDNDPDKPDPASARESRGSVQEAIGKLIGDDAAQAQGSAEREAASTKAADHPTAVPEPKPRTPQKR